MFPIKENHQRLNGKYLCFYFVVKTKFTFLKGQRIAGQTWSIFGLCQLAWNTIPVISSLHAHNRFALVSSSE